MNRTTIFYIALVFNIIAGAWTYHSLPHWSGASFATAIYCLVDMAKDANKKREKLNTSTLNYQYGWADGWNACRSASPENRVFKRTDKIGV